MVLGIVSQADELQKIRESVQSEIQHQVESSLCMEHGIDLQKNYSKNADAH